MKQLVFVEKEQVVTDSLTVAEVFGKRHDLVMRDIRNLECSEEFNLLNFAEIDYVDERNRTYKKFLIKRDGLAFLVMGYTGSKAAEYKEKYIKAFNEMELELKQPRVLTEREQLVATMKLSIEMSEEIVQVKAEVKEVRGMVENQITLDHGEQRRIQRAVNCRVCELESGKEFRKKLFSELHREIKDRFAVTSYKDIKRKDMQTAIRYIEGWVPRRVS